MSTDQKQQPVSEAQRVESLDVLRGFALLGILTMNIGSFSMPAATYFNPTVYGDLTGINEWVWRLTHLLADQKFMAIFSMLFGAGIVLMSEKAASAGRPATGLHYRRMFWLIVFGLLHAHLIWYGDILYWYGMCGLLAFLFRNFRVGWLLTLGLLFLGFASTILLLAGLSLDQWPQVAIDATSAEMIPPPDQVQREIAAYRGSWLEQMEFRVPEALDMETGTFLVWALWRVTGLILIGMAMFKLGVFQARRSRRFYLMLIGIALFVGLPVISYGIAYNFSIDWKAPEFFFLGTLFNYWGSIVVGLGWVGVVMLICQSDRLQRLTRPFAAVGRTAFSNYILQSVIATLVFYGHGIGLFGELERIQLLLIVVAIWIFQLVISPIWLNHFLFGPLEWLWRSLVYLQMQPFRRTGQRLS